MPELPDIEILRREAEKCRNNPFTRMTVNDKKFVNITHKAFNEKLNGKMLKEVVRHGKYLFLQVDPDAAVVIHFGMTGSIVCLDNNEESPPYTKCTFGFGNRKNLHCTSRRKLGKIEMAPGVEPYLSEQNAGPDAMEIGQDEFVSIFRNRFTQAKPAITDQSLISGIGNVYADEILFQAGIHPREKIGKLKEEELVHLYKTMHEVLKTAVAADADVSKLPDDYLLPHRKQDAACPRCSGKLETIKISGRTTVFCPSCQKM
jgi:formamidopyrimidine-DNA glycosylase